MTRRIGIKDVAREAGVSAATVSLVLNDRSSHRIPAVTQERVRRVAAEIGYAPNTLARGLRTRQTRTIGFVSDRIATTPYAVRMIEAAQDAARANGHLLFLVNTGGDPELEREAIATLQAQQVDGFVYACMWHRAVDVPPTLPTGSVLLDARPVEGDFPAVVPDDRGGAVAAVQELVDAGHTRIAYVDIDEDPAPLASGLRLAGYLEVLERAGITPDPALHVRGESDAAGGREAASRVLELPADRRPTALFCFNDRIAMGAYAAARHHGMEIPTDLSVVGYDDQQLIAAELDPPLTTVALPHAEMGRWAVEVLLGARDRPSAEEGPVLMPCPLIRRDSVGPPPTRQQPGRRRA
ncbi:LacI family DNA-binding transcriptional regulator [Cellulomonas carbonis]|uniref:LacI family transcriptional regulator n=1 Tax=Cellulomonas carbonis T26 TaxID=947969 RepID=A0A0A0BUL5_9CELL|nr:LacI family DNA-binding transcriptional regulator [Cellulomonas carbonis]KGM11382.1 LacI family transcriptional regulator [Cellulomonas carbonis T26]GGC00734.1 alanine racemase [Cellulomonas carbonis]